jgi:nicotinamide-nucleotide amidase
MEVRRLRSAVLITVGSELTTGETRDTNGGDLARELTALGVDVRSIQALPDDRPVVTDAVRRALEEVDLLVTSGGLGPTPDDLTREAIAAACGEVPVEDDALLAWLHGLYDRRGMVMPEVNRKQAWLIPSATALPNPAGTAPGWWVERPDGRVIVALPGPPAEMLPVWRDGALPRLRARGLGDDRASVTLRLAGIGESVLVELLGEPRLRAMNPLLATYARPDAVDLRISAVASAEGTASELIARAEAEIDALVAPYLFARGRESWVDALEVRLRGRRLATVEIGSGGQLGALLGAAPWLVFAETLAPDSALATAHHDLVEYATRVRAVGAVEIGLAVRARERKGDTAVTIAADIEGRVERVTRTAFLGGEQGRRRAALAAAGELWRWLGPDAAADPVRRPPPS